MTEQYTKQTPAEMYALAAGYKRLAVYLTPEASIADAASVGEYGGEVDCRIVSSVDAKPGCIVLDVAEGDVDYVCGQLDEEPMVAEYMVKP